MESPPPAVFHDKAKRTQQGNLLEGGRRGAEGKRGTVGTEGNEGTEWTEGI